MSVRAFLRVGMCECVCVSVHVLVTACGSMRACICVCEGVCVSIIMCVHSHDSENIFKVFLLVLHLIPQVGLFSLSCHKFSAISVSQNHKMFKEKKALMPTL